MNVSLHYLKLISLPYSHLEESLLVSNTRRGPGTFAPLFLSLCNMVLKCLLHSLQTPWKPAWWKQWGQGRGGNTDFLILFFWVKSSASPYKSARQAIGFVTCRETRGSWQLIWNIIKRGLCFGSSYEPGKITLWEWHWRSQGWRGLCEDGMTLGRRAVIEVTTSWQFGTDLHIWEWFKPPWWEVACALHRVSTSWWAKFWGKWFYVFLNACFTEPLEPRTSYQLKRPFFLWILICSWTSQVSWHLSKLTHPPL